MQPKALYERIGLMLIFAVIAFGVFARFYKITEPNFIYYDEGLYLEHNISFLYYVDHHPTQSFTQLLKYLEVCWHVALSDTKTIWFFLANMRTFTVGTEAVYFTKLLSAIFGGLTIGVVYLFARHFYASRAVGLLAALLLAVLPSHVYYSRLGLQEAICTFFFTGGIYFYLTARGLHWRTILSGILFGCVFFTNYRMIILPAVLLFIELYLHFAAEERFDVRRVVYGALAFLIVVFGFGALDGGANTKITFGWMFHQADLAKGTFDPINFLSYPYYIFRFETALFGLLLFANVYFFKFNERKKLLPFLIVVLLMVMFSAPQEKGLRYLCVVYPLMATAVAAFVVYIYRRFSSPLFQRVTLSVVAVMIFWQMANVCQIMGFKTDYGSVVKQLKEQNINPGLSVTQPVIFKVLIGEKAKVIGPGFEPGHFLTLYQQGYKYFVLDPQAYVTYGDDGQRFSQSLKPFLEFIKKNVPPEKVFPHFSNPLLDRFVMEHNENLGRSIKFLQANTDRRFNKLYVYDIQKILLAMRAGLKKN